MQLALEDLATAFDGEALMCATDMQRGDAVLRAGEYDTFGATRRKGYVDHLGRAKFEGTRVEDAQRHGSDWDILFLPAQCAIALATHIRHVSERACATSDLARLAVELGRRRSARDVADEPERTGANETEEFTT